MQSTETHLEVTAHRGILDQALDCPVLATLKHTGSVFFMVPAAQAETQIWECRTSAVPVVLKWNNRCHPHHFTLVHKEKVAPLQRTMMTLETEDNTRQPLGQAFPQNVQQTSLTNGIQIMCRIMRTVLEMMHAVSVPTLTVILENRIACVQVLVGNRLFMTTDDQETRDCRDLHGIMTSIHQSPVIMHMQMVFLGTMKKVPGQKMKDILKKDQSVKANIPSQVIMDILMTSIMTDILMNGKLTEKTKGVEMIKANQNVV